MVVGGGGIWGGMVGVWCDGVCVVGWGEFIQVGNHLHSSVFQKIHSNATIFMSAVVKDCKGS